MVEAMTHTSLVSYLTFGYLACSILYLACIFVKTRTVVIVGAVLTTLGFLVHTAAILWRWIDSYRLGMGHAPFSNMYESLVLFAWMIVAIFLVILLRYKHHIYGAFVLPLASVCMAATSLVSEDIKPLVPALQSNWLTYHVLTCFLGYAAFAVAFMLSLVYLFKSGREPKGGKKRKKDETGELLPTAAALDELSYRVIAVGFPLLTIGIVTGAAWAQYAWGTYWSWDPKETWSLIVWFIYAAYLHARITRGWRGRRAAYLSIIGFAATLFCYVGVNYVLSGLHSYAG